MIFISTTSTKVFRDALQRKSNAAVTFTDAQSGGSFVIVHHMRGRANISGKEQHAYCQVPEVFKVRFRSSKK